MKKAMHIILATLVLLAIIYALQASPFRSDRLATSLRLVALQAMRVGYNCRADGRTLNDCEAEQLDRWNKVAAGETLPPRK